MKISLKDNLSTLAVRIVELLLAAILVVVIFRAFSNLSDSDAVSGREKLENAVRRAAVSCFAEEGVYPPSVDYIVDNYGLIIDEDRYTVHYNSFADNIMPDITVTERTKK